MIIDTLRLDEDTKRRLTSLKRRTGILQWNILGRWAFCISISSDHVISSTHDHPTSSVEMTWKVFAGQNSKVYEALVLQSHFFARKIGFTGSVHDTVSEHIRNGASILLTGKKAVNDCKSLLFGAVGELKSK